MSIFCLTVVDSLYLDCSQTEEIIGRLVGLLSGPAVWLWCDSVLFDQCNSWLSQTTVYIRSRQRAASNLEMTRFFVKISIIYSVEAHACIVQERTRKGNLCHPVSLFLLFKGPYPVAQAGPYPVAQAVLEVLNIVITGIHHDVSLENWFLV